MVLYLMVWRADYYEEAATRLHERERSIKAARGRILDRNGVVLADNKTVCTVSVIHNQITEPEKVIAMLVKELEITEAEARKRVEKYSSMERVKSNVDKSIGDRIREYDLAGVKVDEDYKRYYPYGDLASKVLGFTGGDNQGIIGLEVIYEETLQGEPGMILTVTDAKGIEVDTAGERRVEPVPGRDLRISIDRNIQEYAAQLEPWPIRVQMSGILWNMRLGSWEAAWMRSSKAATATSVSRWEKSFGRCTRFRVKKS